MRTGQVVSKHQYKNKKVFHQLLLFAILFGVISGIVGTDTPDKELPKIQLNAYECETGNTYSTEQMSLLALGKTVGVALTNALCESKIVSQQYGSVKATWHEKEANEIEALMAGQPTLVAFPQDLIEALPSTEAHGYQKLAYYPSYKTFFIALDHVPKLSKAYFLDKRIGLIKSPKSGSGHIAPLATLRDLGMIPGQLDVSYVASHYQLREELRKGSFDVIASYWNETDHEWTNPEFALQYGDEALGYGWYLKTNDTNRPLICAVANAIRTLATNTEDTYFQALQLAVQCDKVAQID